MKSFLLHTVTNDMTKSLLLDASAISLAVGSYLGMLQDVASGIIVLLTLILTIVRTIRTFKKKKDEKDINNTGNNNTSDSSTLPPK